MRVLCASMVAMVVFSAASHAQDAQSLGDLARQVRAQKQQQDAQTDVSADPNAKGAQLPKAPYVFTNEDLPEHGRRTSRSQHSTLTETDAIESPASRAAEGVRWKEEILEQKNTTAELQTQITTLSKSIRYSTRGIRWNEAQERKQAQVDDLKSRLEEEQQRLEDMQEAARRRGYGSSVYDP